MSQSAAFMLPEKGVPSAVVWTVRRWCLDCAAGLEESSISEIQRLQKFCRCNCWVFAAQRKSEGQLTAESAECCRTRGSSHLPSRGACLGSDWRTTTRHTKARFLLGL